jgi:hypothetical protein
MYKTIPVSSIYHKEQPDDLFNDSEEEKWKENKPEDEKYSFV